jgi:hypothetical protein
MDTAAANSFAHQDQPPSDGAPYWDPSKPCKPGVDYLRRLGDKNNANVAICVDMSRQRQSGDPAIDYANLSHLAYNSTFFFLHGSPNKKAACWKNELFGDGHATSVHPEEMRPRWGHGVECVW